LLLADAGRHKEAGDYLERALPIWEDTLGPNHPDTARALTNLAAFHSSAGRYALAEPLFQRALAVAQSSLGDQHRLVGNILLEYAVLLRKTKRKKEAKRFETRARAIQQSQAREELGRHTIDLRDLRTLKDIQSGESR
jgi:tetratricopeptide (TPR) repeat protein